ncbi:YheC/YheD family endospore coat-associated protein [Paenibacillus sp. 481]|uniref:YheC/YheD family endospore coat-associated protein n=1 Tax=Paenibacillus sp. 481 TaxID=2835869 RepID=UPI001E317C4B|nr:YheC/YheD family protein [Paenibacillus sp. 481]UHA72421.1 YheC/YheD family protein [Paenibacillus sp. 481]
MSKTKVTLQVISSGILREEVLMLGEAYVKQWKIPVNQPLTLRFGSFKHHVTVVPVPRYDGLRMNHVLARKMGLQSGVTLRAVYKSASHTLCLGPLVGVMISRDRPDTPDKPFGQITLFCKELVDACQAHGAVACFFTPEQILDQYSGVQGWVYANGCWQKATMPIPDVINNRLPSRKIENKPSVQHFMKEVKLRHKTHIFNEKFLDKTEVFDALQPDVQLQKYLPESHLLRSFTTLKTMCARYNTVFLKPARGSLGKGIVRVSKLPDNTYQAMYSTVNGTRRQSFSSLLKLFSSLSGKMKTNSYQIQQGLTLIENEKRPVDFRALVQKNATGKWTITSIVARVASNQHFVSNLARGGTLSTVKEAITSSELSSDSRTDIYVRLQRAALDIARGVETYIPLHFGELGIDLAVDEHGRVWLLEVNSKPSKSDNTPLNESKIRPSVRKMVEYARHLAGF